MIPTRQLPEERPLDPRERERYIRQLSLPEVGEEGQRKLASSRVLCVGVGGLGSPVALYLAAAGVGTIGLVDPDVVNRSNLHRQILFSDDDIGQPKVRIAERKLRATNPLCRIVCHEVAFLASNALAIAADYDVVIDGTDNFSTRYLSNDVAVSLGIPNVYASIYRFEGQVSVFAPHLYGGCYRCMFPTPPRAGLVPDCSEAGVLGVLPGIVGTLQATEAIKLILKRGDPLLGRLLHFDALTMGFRKFGLRKDPGCPACGTRTLSIPDQDYSFDCSFEAHSRSSVESISPVQLAAKMATQRELRLIDVRDPADQFYKPIPGSILLPESEWETFSPPWKNETEAIVYCTSGNRSREAVRVISTNANFRVLNLEGGIAAFASEVSPELAVH